VVLSPAVRTIGISLLRLLPSSFHWVDCVTIVSHENSDRLTRECFPTVALPSSSLGSSSFSFQSMITSLALWSCGRRVSVVQAQRQWAGCPGLVK